MAGTPSTKARKRASVPSPRRAKRTVADRAKVMKVPPAGEKKLTVKGGVNLDHFGGAKVDQLVKG